KTRRLYGAVKQYAAEFFLQALNLPRDRGLGERKMPAGSLDGPDRRHGKESTKLFDHCLSRASIMIMTIMNLQNTADAVKVVLALIRHKSNGAQQEESTWTGTRRRWRTGAAFCGTLASSPSRFRSSSCPVMQAPPLLHQC